jgi:chromosome segregation ATPase
MGAPVPHTCPVINGAQKDIESLIKELDKFTPETGDIESLIQNVIWVLDNNYSTLEDMRKSNGALRDWGTELEEEVSALKNEIDRLEDEKCTLEYDKSCLEDQVNELEEEKQRLEDRVEYLQSYEK